MKRALALVLLALALTACSEDRSRCQQMYDRLEDEGQAREFALTEEQWLDRCEQSMEVFE